MPDFVIVVSDPLAAKEGGRAKVKVVGDAEMRLTGEMKDKYELPKIKANPELISKLNAAYGIATIRARRTDTGEKVKITGELVADQSVPPDEVRVSDELLVNLAGTSEIEGEIMRARAWQRRLKGEAAPSIVGLKIGDVIGGELVGLKGVKLRITGGSDISGFPMLPSVAGMVKKAVILSGPPGFWPKKGGERRKKMVRGNVVPPDVAQVNVVIEVPQKA
ncbi:MAG: 30S ribosomal protein S6e [Desulfurococcaceae archaeon]